MTGKNVSAPEKLGADVPFFLTGGTAYVEGIGEKITPVADYSGRILVIAKGREGVSTAEAYGNIDRPAAPQHPAPPELTEAIISAPDTAYRYFGNLFEQAVQLAEVEDIKGDMLKYCARRAVMTGSGSAVFGLFTDPEQSERCVDRLREKGYFAVICETVPESFIII